MLRTDNHCRRRGFYVYSKSAIDCSLERRLCISLSWVGAQAPFDAPFGNRLDIGDANDGARSPIVGSRGWFCRGRLGSVVGLSMAESLAFVRSSGCAGRFDIDDRRFCTLDFGGSLQSAVFDCNHLGTCVGGAL